MAWFARSRSSTETEDLLLGALDDVLAHIEAQQDAPPSRLVRLRERLTRSPVPTGLRRELAAVISQLDTAPPIDDGDLPSIVGELSAALVRTLDVAALLDAELEEHIDELEQRVPPRIGVGDARALTREAARVREVAVPARERAERTRREVARLVTSLAGILEPTLRQAASLDWGIGELSGRLAGAREPDALMRVRQELTSITKELAGNSAAMRKQLGKAMMQVRSLEVALEDTRKQLARVREDSERDPLTGLLNRGGFDRRLVDSLQARSGRRAEDRERSFCLVLIDIDHFKRVNDTHGHPAGDEVLRRVAEHLTAQVRGGDVVGRVGGEEFGIVLEDVDRSAAVEIIERIRSSVEADTYTHEGAQIRVTLSAGIATHEDDETALELYKRADAALYEAKAGGRNRFVLAA